MGLLSVLKKAFSGNKINLEQRFEFSRKWIQGSGGRFHIVKEKATQQTYGLKLIDSEKSRAFREKFPAETFASESEIAATFKHPHIVEAHETGIASDGSEFILMQFVNGPLLENLLLDGKRALLAGRETKIIMQMADALLRVHSAGYVHRDFCPRNIVFNRALDTPQLFDFGLTIPDKKEFRTTANRTGTPLYMAPEIVRRREMDIRVDIFAFGIVAFQLLTGQHPWGVSENSSKSALLFDSRKPANILDLNPNLDKLIARAITSCIEIDPAERCASMKHFVMATGISNKAKRA